MAQSSPGVLLALRTLAAGATLALLANPLYARAPLYGVLDAPALLNCEEQHWHGDRAAAQRCYRELTTHENGLLRAEAFWALGDLQSANTQFQQAQDAQPGNPQVRLRWGELFVRTYQYQDAFDLFSEALELDPDNAWAHIGAARALQEGGDPEQVNSHLMTVVDDIFAPPGARLRGLIMMIRAALQQDRYREATEILNEAETLASEENLPGMELNALRAAHAFMTQQPYQAYIDAALEEAPGYGDAWAIPGYFAEIIRRYEQAGTFFEQAVTVQPDHWDAHLELGQNYLRLNRVERAREHIRLAYDGDAFNPRTINLLRLLDTFVDDMEVLSFPSPPEGAFPRLQLRLAKSESGVLQDYARDLAEQSIATYSKRYRFEPKQPIVVEIYPNHEDFVVRSIGMPGVGILGVTFGYLFAMDSPTAHPRGEAYHWGTTLWHEMAHVFTLKATDNLVPRWFSEGISVFEEWRTGPIPGRKIPLNVYQAMAEGKFLPIAELDDGFMRPSYEDQVIVSYMQAGLVFEFIDIEYGFDHIVDMLYRFNDGVSAVEAIEQSLGISAQDFDQHFKQFIDIEYGPMLGRMDLWQQDTRDSFQALEEENWAEAVAAAERANFVFPDYVEPDSPYLAMARAYRNLDDPDNEFRALETFWRKGGYAARPLMTLANHYLEREQQQEALDVLTDVIWADPFLEELHVKLGDLHLAMGEPRLALREYEVLLALDPLDKASANLKLATAYQALGNNDKTMEYLMTALDIAPQYRPAQRLLLELSRGDTE